MSTTAPTSIAELLLLRRGLVFLDEATEPAVLDEHQRLGFLLELANLGYFASERLRLRANASSPEALVALRDQLLAGSAKAAGGHARLSPLFRQFPKGVPEDTRKLWWDRVIVHVLQRPDQPCVLCTRTGTLQVLDPCMHAICASCFDGSNYGGCPICNRTVNRESPFFRAAPPRPESAVSARTFQLLDLGNPSADRTTAAAMALAAREVFTTLCLRAQAMAPTDVDALLLIVSSYPAEVVSWLPAELPVRENRALVFATLLRGLLLSGSDAKPDARRGPRPDVTPIFEAARAHLTTATDVLRLIVAYSGAPVALLPEAKLLRADPADTRRWGVKNASIKRGVISINQHRFKVAPLPRPVRRHLLALLERIPPEQLLEDVLRHEARWIWVAELLHPREYAGRFPGAARVFNILRNGPAADGAPPIISRARTARPARQPEPPRESLPARILRSVFGSKPASVPAAEGPGPQTMEQALAQKAELAEQAARPAVVPLRPWPGAVEKALSSGDSAEALSLLSQRPGELLRRFDLLLRRAADPDAVVDAFARAAPRTATPALVALRNHLAVRATPLAARVFWPKAAFCVPAPPVDKRPLLAAPIVARVTAVIDAELVRRFADKPPYDTAILDDELATIIVPFNERTASRSAVQLPRGSSIEIAEAKELRLFMHWCEPAKGGYENETDLDLSIGFFDDAWNLVGTCAYYQLDAKDAAGNSLARSSGDFTSAPYPDGAAEFVDFDRARARAAGYRYAVMIVNAFSGLPFSALERATAGVMLRDDPAAGDTFDPRTVALAFALAGNHGVFMPLLVDLETSRLHWLDAYSRGQFAFNNVANSARSVGRICPAMLSYFASGTRPSMLDLARYHAAARCRRVLLRGPTETRAFVRSPDESPLAFLTRLRTGAPDSTLPNSDLESSLSADPTFAILLRGDLSLPEHSAIYALFRQRLLPTLSASDLLA
jgi:Prokaryotic RING finger family 4